MACQPALGATEMKYLAMLNAARAFRLEDSKLVFLGENGDELVVFARMK
jgi:heat shock protein HslJ